MDSSVLVLGHHRLCLRSNRPILWIMVWDEFVAQCWYSLQSPLGADTITDNSLVFSISTGALGSVSIAEYFIRFRRLWRKNSTCRVIGARRYYVRILSSDNKRSC